MITGRLSVRSAGQDSEPTEDLHGPSASPAATKQFQQFDDLIWSQRCDCRTLSLICCHTTDNKRVYHSAGPVYQQLYASRFIVFYSFIYRSGVVVVPVHVLNKNVTIFMNINRKLFFLSDRV